jgi:two-component system, NarL family, nitrate/nitrite response regulator NarL
VSPLPNDTKLRTVLIVDGDRLFAEALRWTLEELGMDVVGIAETLPGALDIARATRPILVFIDMGLHDAGATGDAIRKERPDTVILSLVPATQTTDTLDAAPGMDGYVAKDAPVSTFLDAVSAALEGRVDIGRPGSTDRIEPRPPEGTTARIGDALSDREREVLGLLTEGLSSKAMAEQLRIGTSTVSTHVQNVLTKLGVHSRLGAVAIALNHGLVDTRGSRRLPRGTPQT